MQEKWILDIIGHANGEEKENAWNAWGMNARTECAFRKIVISAINYVTKKMGIRTK